MADLREARERMVRTYIEARGIRDPSVLAALRMVPREAFLPADLAEFAYDDVALGIDEGQTISQPYVVALMTAALRLTSADRVLEIGTGSGYSAAVLSHIAREVYTVERLAALVATATEKLREQGCANVRVKLGDGTLGWPEHAPYDAIAVAAGGPNIPPALLAQLADGGRLVIPLGKEKTVQRLVRVTRAPDGDLVTEHLIDVRFVPLIGAQGWDSGETA